MFQCSLHFDCLFPFADISTEEESCKSDDPSENKRRRLAGIVIIKRRNFILSLRFKNLYYIYGNEVSERWIQRSKLLFLGRTWSFLSNARGKTIKDISLFFYHNNLLFLSWFTSAASMPKINDQSLNEYKILFWSFSPRT